MLTTERSTWELLREAKFDNGHKSDWLTHSYCKPSNVPPTVRARPAQGMSTPWPNSESRRTLYARVLCLSEGPGLVQKRQKTWLLFFTHVNYFWSCFKNFSYFYYVWRISITFVMFYEFQLLLLRFKNFSYFCYVLWISINFVTFQEFQLILLCFMNFN